MAKSVLSRYLDPAVLGRVAKQRIEPRGLVIGNLAGAHKSPLSGFAVEFAGHREYVWGDDPKHIDWRVYFNRQRYMIKQYAMETNFVCHLLLDTSASMRYGEGAGQKLRYAAQMAATLGYAILRQSDKVSLATFDDRVRGFVPPSSSMAQIVRITEHLDQTEPFHKTNMADCLSELAGMVKFVGLELPEGLLTRPDELRREYLAALARFNDEFEAICHRNRIERVLVDTARDMGEVLADYLNQRSRLHRGR